MASCRQAVKTLEDFQWDFNPSIKRKQIYDLATCQFIQESRDILFLGGPPGVGKTFLSEALGYQAIKMGYTVLYRSIFDLVREFMKDEAFSGEEKTLTRYLKADLVIIDDTARRLRESESQMKASKTSRGPHSEFRTTLSLLRKALSPHHRD